MIYNCSIYDTSQGASIKGSPIKRTFSPPHVPLRQSYLPSKRTSHNFLGYRDDAVDLSPHAHDNDRAITPRTITP